jgi:hypothetical protein
MLTSHGVKAPLATYAATIEEARARLATTQPA